MPKREKKIVANNKKARHDYFIDDVYVVGIVLTGTEIKSVRAGKVSIKESYAKIQDGEIVLIGMNISPYEQGNRFNTEPLRTRKLAEKRRSDIAYLNTQILTKKRPTTRTYHQKQEKNRILRKCPQGNSNPCFGLERATFLARR